MQKMQVNLGMEVKNDEFNYEQEFEGPMGNLHELSSRY